MRWSVTLPCYSVCMGFDGFDEFEVEIGIGRKGVISVSARGTEEETNSPKVIR